VRAATSRRDGLGGSGERKGRRGGPGGGRRPGGPGGGRRGRRDEDFDAEAVRRVTGAKETKFSPFATFFKDREAEDKGSASETDSKETQADA
jgi:hypothetical protein